MNLDTLGTGRIAMMVHQDVLDYDKVKEAMSAEKMLEVDRFLMVIKEAGHLSHREIMEEILLIQQ